MNPQLAIIAALGGQPAIDEWNANGNSLIVGYALEQAKLGEHVANHALGHTHDVLHGTIAMGPVEVPEHTHDLDINFQPQRTGSVR